MTPVPELVDRTTQFVRDHVDPVEREVVVCGRVTDDALRLDFQQKAEEAGVFDPLAVDAWVPDDGSVETVDGVRFIVGRPAATDPSTPVVLIPAPMPGGVKSDVDFLVSRMPAAQVTQWHSDADSAVEHRDHFAWSKDSPAIATQVSRWITTGSAPA
ncbi:hypothetical protein AB0I35_31175 [Nocardia sp. NPDC050378]|uniref:hypothetical protein n=1 Tax=Nocardia sp. NPDC050378 TaxID=3155400 RepID=UPI003404BB00